MANQNFLKLSVTVVVWILWSCSYQQVRCEEVEDGTTTEAPKFMTRGGTFRAVIGDTVTLPCLVENLGRYTLVWKRGNAVLSAADMKITVDPRIHLVDGFNLEIRKVRIHDGGDYICQLSTLTPEDQIYTLEILVPPSVRSEQEDHVTITKGDSVTLQCRGTGNPVPIITWTRKNNLLPNGEETAEGNSFHIPTADRHKIGIYECHANNGVGTPVSASIHVKVNYPPEIELEKTWIHSGDDSEAELSCIVHSEPPATIKWYRDSILVETTDRTLFEDRGTRHSLFIRLVQPSDFGNYSCVADNKLGASKKYIELSGKPNRPLFTGEHVGPAQDSFNITWTVESFSAITESHIVYRHAHMNETHNLRGEWIHIILPAQMTGDIGNHVDNSIAVHPTGPTETSVSTVHFESCQIKNLEAGTFYEVQVTSLNKYGMSQPSEKFSFKTASKDSRSFESSPQQTAADAAQVGELGVGPDTSFALILKPSTIIWTLTIVSTFKIITTIS